MFLPLAGLLVGVLLGLVLNVNVSFEFSRYSAVAILAALDSVLGAVRAELDGVYDNRIFISGFLVNAIVAVLLTPRAVMPARRAVHTAIDARGGHRANPTSMVMDSSR